MPKLGRFTSDAAKGKYLRAYDAMAAEWPVASRDIDVETSFGTTRVRKSGDGDGAPLLLMPGIGGSCLFWHAVIEELGRDRVVYTPDVMGWQGRCEQTAPIRDEGDIAAWVDEVIAGLGVDRVHLAGYSLGAWLAAVAAAYRPERVASLSLLEPAPATFTRPKWSLLFKFMVAGARPTRAKMEKLNAWLSPRIELSELEWEILLAGFKFRPGMPWARPLTDERLAGITMPVMVLFGSETVVHDPEVVAERVRGVIPSADIEIYPGAGHDLLWAIPERVIPRWLEFAGTHDRVRA
ncbi:alpha/beta fold hydrolase [Nocardia sp. NPDC051030]|uniref:alpha/beta fold hydrolase n=1 Tax=Nocardia sp. NPDC051030 TaxID=3155162 RepID=UPI00343D5DB1